MVVALVGIWWAGAAYLPLDPGYPRTRLNQMIAASGARFVISRSLDDLPEHVELVGPEGNEGAPRPAAASPADLAYVIFTSGSTGAPKAVAVTRAGVANLVRALEERQVYGQTPARAAWNASLSFDASVQQWVRIYRGDSVLLLDDATRTDPARLAAELMAHQVTDLDATPSHWAVLRDAVVAAYSTARQPLRLLLGGEAIPPPMWTDLATLAAEGVVEAVNVYGPTECTVDATTTTVDGSSPHLGHPLPGCAVYVLDERFAPTNEGELFLAGVCLARGYLNQPGLTAQHFVPDVVAQDGSRMYSTGDRVRLRDDGCIQFLGRLDQQIKLRGHRIEPQEIETQLLTDPTIGAAAVMLLDDLPGGPGLVAYCTSSGRGEARRPHAVRRALASTLPPFMVPAAIVFMDRMPRTPAGKLDRAALPRPQLEVGGPIGKSSLEQQVCKFWAEALGLPDLGRDHDFFACGGDSLSASRIVARIRASLGLRVPVRLVFDQPRVGNFAEKVAAIWHGAHGEGRS